MDLRSVSAERIILTYHIMTDRFFYNTIHQKKTKRHKFLLLSINIFKSIPQVVSDSYAIFLTKSESIKIVGNSKLYDLENRFSAITGSSYKFIFISDDDWKKFMESYDKTKKYDIIDETEYINTESNSITLAENIFGNENLKID